MADENTTGVPYEKPYPYLRQVSKLPEVTSPRSINLSDLLILVQSTTTKKVPIEHLMSRIIDLIDAPDAYQLACRNGFVGTLQEWLLSLKGEGVNNEELGWVVGKHQIITGSMDLDPNTGEPVTFVRDGTLPIDDTAFLIYRDVNTGKLYTKTIHGTEERWATWEGLLDPFTYINDVIGEESLIPTYYANKSANLPFSVETFLDDKGNEVSYDYLNDVTDENGSRPYNFDRTDFSNYPSLGEIVRFIFTDDRYGKLMYYDGNHFYDYNGVLDYIQVIVNNMRKISTGAARRLETPRNIDIVTDLTDDPVTSIDSIVFDGSEDANFVIRKLNGEVIYGDISHIDNLTMTGNLRVGGTTTSLGKMYANNGLEVNGNTTIDGTLGVSGTATFSSDVIANRNLTVSGDITSSGTITGRDLNITNTITAKQVIVSSTSQSDAISYNVASGITGDNTSSFSTGYFFSPGNANNVAMKINKLSAKLIGNDDYVPKATNAATADVSSKSILTSIGSILRPLVAAEEAYGNQSLSGSVGVKANDTSLYVEEHLNVGESFSLIMPDDEDVEGLEVWVGGGPRVGKVRVLMNTNELWLYDRSDETSSDEISSRAIAKVDFRDASAANVVFYKPIQIEEDATLSIGSETTFTGGDIVLAANEDIYTTLETIEADDGSVSTSVVMRPARFIVYRPSVFNSSVTVYSGITADTVHIRSDSGSGYYARNIAYGTSSTPSAGDVHDGDLYIQYT